MFNTSIGKTVLVFNTSIGKTDLVFNTYFVKVAELDDPKYADMTDTLKQKIKADGGDQASHVYMDCKGRFPADTQAEI